MPPLQPMLATSAARVPTKGGMSFEPKWDGFRCLIFRDGDELFIQSRDEKPLDRYFPELAEPLKAQLPEQCVLDGEIVIAQPDGLDFELLQLRLHPAGRLPRICRSSGRNRSCVGRRTCRWHRRPRPLGSRDR